MTLSTLRLLSLGPQYYTSNLLVRDASSTKQSFKVARKNDQRLHHLIYIFVLRPCFTKVASSSCKEPILSGDAGQLLVFETETDSLVGRSVRSIGIEAHFKWLPIAYSFLSESSIEETSALIKRRILTINGSGGNTTCGRSESSSADVANTSTSGGCLSSHSTRYMNEVG